jgi:hypothetical protein
MKFEIKALKERHHMVDLGISRRLVMVLKRNTI